LVDGFDFGKVGKPENYEDHETGIFDFGVRFVDSEFSREIQKILHVLSVFLFDD
jgi:hypothetical protein